VIDAEIRVGGTRDSAEFDAFYAATSEKLVDNVQTPGAAKVVYGLSAQMDGVIQFLERFGFDHVTLKADSSTKTIAQYPVDYVTDIRNSSGQSVLDRSVSTSTALVIVYCANPNG